MKPSSALRILREAVRAGFVLFSDSARRGMRSHGILSSDVLQILHDANRLRYQDENDTWAVDGELVSSGDAVRVVVSIDEETGLVVVSAHRILRKGD